MSATRQVEKMISGSMSAKEGDSSPEEAPQKTGGHADVDTTRDEEEGTQQSEHEVCKRDAEGAEEPAYPIDEGVLTPWWREAGETREPDRCGVLRSVGTTAVLLRANVRRFFIRSPLKVLLVRKKLIVYN